MPFRFYVLFILKHLSQLCFTYKSVMFCRLIPSRPVCINFRLRTATIGTSEQFLWYTKQNSRSTFTIKKIKIRPPAPIFGRKVMTTEVFFYVA